MDTAHIGVLTVSDRASRGEYEDRGGPAIVSWLERVIASDWASHCRIVPDDREGISEAIVELAEQCSLIVTTGGTGPAPRDVTPEATEDVCRCMLPGFGELMRAVSLQSVPTAILSRQTAGIIGTCLVINLPGKPAAIAECLDAVFPAVPYCIDLVGGAWIETDPEHVVAFRPASAVRPGGAS